MHARTNQKPGIDKRQSASPSTSSTLAPFEVSGPTAFKSRHRALGREARDQRFLKKRSNFSVSTYLPSGHSFDRSV
jgi:hypothetical protein